MTKKFLGENLLFVTAHPDDESYAGAGTILANYKAGGKSYLISATLGEKGKSHLPKPIPDSALKKMRKNELERAAKFLKVEKLFLLRLPDGGVEEKKEIAAKKIMDVAKSVNPDKIVSFGKDGMSGHMDHIAVGEAAAKTAKKLKIPFLAFAPSPQRIKLMKQLSKTLISRRKFGKYAKEIKYEVPNIKVKIDGKAKIKAVSFHKSQLGKTKPFSQFPPKMREQWLKFEYFRAE